MVEVNVTTNDLLFIDNHRLHGNTMYGTVTMSWQNQVEFRLENFCHIKQDKEQYPVLIIRVGPNYDL